MATTMNIHKNRMTSLPQLRMVLIIFLAAFVSNGALAVKPGNNLGVATPVASVDVASGGGLNLNGGTYTTTASDQTYNGAVVLGADTTLNANNVAFASTVDSDGSAWALTVNAAQNASFGGAGHLGGGNLDVDQMHVFEIYAPFALSSIFALTADLQYMKDEMKQDDSPSGFIYGLRLTAEF